MPGRLHRPAHVVNVAPAATFPYPVALCPQHWQRVEEGVAWFAEEPPGDRERRGVDVVMGDELAKRGIAVADGQGVTSHRGGFSPQLDPRRNFGVLVVEGHTYGSDERVRLDLALTPAVVGKLRTLVRLYPEADAGQQVVHHRRAHEAQLDVVAVRPSTAISVARPSPSRLALVRVLRTAARRSAFPGPISTSLRDSRAACRNPSASTVTKGNACSCVPISGVLASRAATVGATVGATVIAEPARVFMLHGTITMPAVRNDLDEMAAAWSPAPWTTSASFATSRAV